MNSKQIIFGVALIAFCCVSLSNSLRCFVCNSKDTCKKAQLYDCNSGLANNTRTYLHQFHSGLNPNATSPFFECFKEYIKTTTGEYYYRNCVYANTNGCTLPLSPYISSTTKKHDCKQCNSNGCNPASRVGVDVMTVFATLVAAFILRYVWH
ncbi:uncharacterized protein LOC119601026 isoform X2 [Lucilia sericata]|uniref:uncharacterized protein LOC119601026 isoform X2 n=1 Tax=Lucilia sericata TaxID=13632 RepID=UPI0018A7EA4D|nr:uncharacterized protein LOC119601026 isoform X2 [Lucilia sericata]